MLQRAIFTRGNDVKFGMHNQIAVPGIAVAEKDCGFSADLCRRYAQAELYAVATAAGRVTAQRRPTPNCSATPRDALYR